jgi:hypothetical protein
MKRVECPSLQVETLNLVCVCVCGIPEDKVVVVKSLNWFERKVTIELCRPNIYVRDGRNNITDISMKIM